MLKMYPMLVLSSLLLSGCGVDAMPTNDKQLSFSNSGSLPATVVIAYGETINVGELAIGFERVLGDSRCPKGVQCIRAGEVEVLLTLSNGKSSMELTAVYPLQPKVRFADYAVTLLKVTPYPVSGVETQPSDYRVTVKVEKAL